MLKNKGPDTGVKQVQYRQITFFSFWNDSTPLLKRAERKNKPNCKHAVSQIAKTNNNNNFYQKLKTIYSFVCLFSSSSRSLFRMSFDEWLCVPPRRTRVWRPTSSWRCRARPGCCHRSRWSRAAPGVPRSGSWYLWELASSLQTADGRRSLWKGWSRLKKKKCKKTR